MVQYSSVDQKSRQAHCYHNVAKCCSVCGSETAGSYCTKPNSLDYPSFQLQSLGDVQCLIGLQTLESHVHSLRWLLPRWQRSMRLNSSSHCFAVHLLPIHIADCCHTARHHSLGTGLQHMRWWLAVKTKWLRSAVDRHILEVGSPGSLQGRSNYCIGHIQVPFRCNIGLQLTLDGHFIRSWRPRTVALSQERVLGGWHLLFNTI